MEVLCIGRGFIMDTRFSPPAIPSIPIVCLVVADGFLGGLRAVAAS
jgi:hypothetical protein